MSKKKKVTAPEYKRWEGNAYTNELEEARPGYNDWVANNWQSMITAPDYKTYTGLANEINKVTMNDLLNSYQEGANRLASQNYNRFGGLRSTPSLITEDRLNRQMNDLSNRVASSSLQNAIGLANQQYQNNLSSLGTVNNLYNYAGDYVTQNKDIPNWQIDNRNIEAKYLADVQNAQGGGGFNLGNAIGGAISGAATGAMTGNPFAIAGGALIGGALGGFSGGSGAQASQLGGAIGSIPYIYQQGRSGGYGTGYGSGVNLNTKAGQVAYGNYGLNTQYNPSSWKFSWQ